MLNRLISGNMCIGVTMAAFAIFAVLALPPQVAIAQTETEFPIKSYQDVEKLFAQLDYTTEAWQKGVRSVPRLYLKNIPSRWRGATSKEISVKEKKRIFFRLMAPLVLHANELITIDRAKLLVIQKISDLTSQDLFWLTNLAVTYKIVKEDEEISETAITELIKRVDIVPVSLALAQSAEESGWGTSRFADLGNAVFGQWTWGGKGITPAGQRKSLGDYKIASFDEPLGSVKAYMRNINTHNAYKNLRSMRAEFRDKSQPISGWKLAETLSRYSERGPEYVKSLHAIMRVNKLKAADDAVLVGDISYSLIPVGDGSD